MGTKKQLIFNADDFGISEGTNDAIKECFLQGIITATSIMPTAPCFLGAAEMLSEINDVNIGVHLDIIEFQSIQKKRQNKSLLYDCDGKFNNGYLDLIRKSYSKTFMLELESEFRSQIETVLKYTKIQHIDSHVHTHAIPKIFELTCKLAKEYDIPYIRTQFEHPYFVFDLKKYFSSKYPINLIKLFLLNSFSLINKPIAQKYDLITNDCFVGIEYTGFMDKNTILCGIKKAPEASLVEVIAHPTTDKNKIYNYNEYLTLMSTDILTENDIEIYNF